MAVNDWMLAQLLGLWQWRKPETVISPSPWAKREIAATKPRKKRAAFFMVSGVKNLLIRIFVVQL